MKKNKISVYVLIVGLALSLGIPAFALTTNVKDSVEGSVNIKSDGEGSDKVNLEVNSKSEDNATSSEDKDKDSNDKIKDNDNDKDNYKENASTTDSETADEHKSVVATFVQNLLSVADREKGIGDEVKTIAKEQYDSASTTVEAITEVEGRGKIASFLFGTDYKNIGVIRSELAKTSERINKLTDLASSTKINISDKEDLNLQVEALKNNQAKLDDFIKSKESQFSLLGWFVKLFNK